PARRNRWGRPATSASSAGMDGRPSSTPARIHASRGAAWLAARDGLGSGTEALAIAGLVLDEGHLDVAVVRLRDVEERHTPFVVADPEREVAFRVGEPGAITA